jgi:hypothetical protein
MTPALAHIAGIPLEETLAMAAPVLGATCAALMATLRNRGRRPWRRGSKPCGAAKLAPRRLGSRARARGLVVRCCARMRAQDPLPSTSRPR